MAENHLIQNLWNYIWVDTLQQFTERWRWSEMKGDCRYSWNWQNWMPEKLFFKREMYCVFNLGYIKATILVQNAKWPWVRHFQCLVNWENAKKGENKAIMCIILLKACKSLYSTFIPRIEEELGCLQLSGSSFLVTQSSSSWNDRLHKRLEVVH